MTDFYNLSLKESSLFENYSSKGYNDLLIALKLADERITNRILRTDGDWTRQKLNETKALINEEINNAYGGLFQSMQQESILTAQVVLGASIGIPGAELPKAVINDLLNNNRQIQGYGFKELFDVSSDNHARQLRVLLSSGVAQGLTANQIVKEYGIKSSKLSRGQIQGNVFTTIADSRDQGRYVAFKQLEDEDIVKGYIFDATLDSGTTLYCRSHDQKRYFQKIEDIQQYIKVHFRCRSIFRPIPHFSESDTRASQFGQVESEPYEKWYLKQDAEFHKSTLTNKQYNAFLEKKYDVKSLADLTKKNGLSAIQSELNR